MKLSLMIPLVILITLPFQSAFGGLYEKNSSIDDLRTYAKRNNKDAILEIGIRKDKGSIELLQSIIASSDAVVLRMRKEVAAGLMDASMFDVRVENKRRAVVAAKMALARMGEDKNSQYFNEFVVGLSSTNAFWEIDCIIALGYIGDQRAIKYLAPILWQQGGAATHHISYGIFAVDAAAALDLLVHPSFRVGRLAPNGAASRLMWKI